MSFAGFAPPSRSFENWFPDWNGGAYGRVAGRRYSSHVDAVCGGNEVAYNPPRSSDNVVEFNFGGSMLAPLVLSLALAAGDDGLWGDVGFGFYPTDSDKVAPNGTVYDPMFRIVFDLNLGSNDSYFFANSAYYAEKPNPGVTTNKSQGEFDFTKRQYDFNIGYAFEVQRSLEARFWLYSMSNINRGRDLSDPYGFKDGFVGSVRHSFEEFSNVQGYTSIGYYFTKELVGTDGHGYSPGLFAEINANRFLGYGVRGFSQITALTEKGGSMHEIDAQLGLEYRMGLKRKTRAFFYLETDFGVDGLTDRRRLLFEFRRDFSGS